MAIVDHSNAVEMPWRPGYRRFTLAGKEHGVTCSASLSVIEPGVGAPTHFHNSADEVIVVVEGALDMWIGDERMRVGANHTVSLPAGVPHGFVAVGPGPARILAFLPQSGEAVATTYVDGEPPAGADRR
ncbi:MAG TPA: cupin domain-containing protein [Stellaceae bacterium]|jgi:quercetin dioxygenase-like cupin family protein|nr:cupin domain-containing protein [Stellaceae bacterium]